MKGLHHQVVIKIFCPTGCNKTPPTSDSTYPLAATSPFNVLMNWSPPWYPLFFLIPTHGESTVTTMALNPAFSALCTIFCVFRLSLFKYVCIHSIPLGALFATSSIRTCPHELIIMTVPHFSAPRNGNKKSDTPIKYIYNIWLLNQLIRPSWRFLSSTSSLISPTPLSPTPIHIDTYLTCFMG